MFIMVLHNSLFVCPQPCQEWQTMGGLCDLFVGHVPTKRTPGHVDKKNVGHRGSTSAMWSTFSKGKEYTRQSIAGCNQLPSQYSY